jgi:hypothetical protein
MRVIVETRSISLTTPVSGVVDGAHRTDEVWGRAILEHVDNLGAYTASHPETGLLIPSDYVN